MRAIEHPIKDRKIKVAVVGCGKISSNHLKAITELSDQFELSAVCDSNTESLERTTSAYQVQGYPDINSLLEAKNDVDVLTLCSPSGLHAKQTIEIAHAKKHIVTEKPMATRWSDGVNMLNECDKANVKLFVVKQVRYQPTIELLNQAVKEKRFGRIYLVNLNVFWTRPQSYYAQAKWRGTWEFDGGAFMNQASHYVDLLHWIFGPIQTVHAMLSTLAMDIETEDTGVLNLRWRSGALGSMNVTMLTYPKNFETSLTVIGENGSVRIGGLSANEIQHWEFAEPHPQDALAETLKTPVVLDPHYGHKRYYENVAQTLRGESQAITDGREGLRSLEILIAAYLSARDNKQVSLPLVY